VERESRRPESKSRRAPIDRKRRRDEITSKCTPIGKGRRPESKSTCANWRGNSEGCRAKAGAHRREREGKNSKAGARTREGARGEEIKSKRAHVGEGAEKVRELLVSDAGRQKLAPQHLAGGGAVCGAG
jgi:hypothetical protein